MKVLFVLVAILGVALSAQQAGPQFPPFKRMFVDHWHPNLETPGSRILNGSEVIPHSIPYQVFLIVNSHNQSWSCSGSLISRQYILTAGHCLDGGTNGSVLLGAHDITKNETSQQIIFVDKFIVHEEYDKDSINDDIGLIEIPYALNFSNEVNISILPTREEAKNSYADNIARLSGWGLTDGFANGGSPVLLATESKVISNTECERWFPTHFRDNQICTSGDNNKGGCNGDSGGPLIDINSTKLIGIVSYGIAFCISEYPSAFTRVGSFLDWIEEHSDVKIL